MSGKKAHVHHQGSRDCLCGTYAVMNAIATCLERHDHPAPWSLTKDLFPVCIRTLEQENRLERALTWGMSNRQMKAVLKPARLWVRKRTGFTLSWHRPYHNRLDVPFADLRHCLEDHLDGVGTSAILCLWGALDHWTVAHRLTAKSILLNDSSWVTGLRLKTCDTADPDVSGKRHQIVPTGLYLISLSRESTD